MAITNREELTPREREEMDFTKEENVRAREHSIQIKKLELEDNRINQRWTQVFRIPLSLLSLPVKIILAFALPFYILKGKDAPDIYWKALKF